ncbi:single-stranded DNA-binding protein [Bifidobacterium sp. ESL0745]|uniref:single-stranded DNA-binding protein n=1 Tax=Bifidobacterium sp. ESL0745 TaxID=2983226 RepID=UPI0023F89A1C|nr:single-stranded DNA-binding protein [Bifidobacterium sp. ESL0745]MDF7665701.1 single-stranded DNA-binding protein [Bifidobacterium sp. ESL0745]
MSAGDTVITIVGNLTADPELRTIGSGASVASFTIASTPRTFNRQTNQWEDGNALFMRCSAWRDMADHCASSLSKGMRVIAQGRLQQRSYTANDGSNRTVVEMTVDEIGPSLRYATTQVTKANHNNGGNWPGQGNGDAYQDGSGQPAPWNNAQQNSQANYMPHDPTAPVGSEPDPWGAVAQQDEFGGDSGEPEF